MTLEVIWNPKSELIRSSLVRFWEGSCRVMTLSL
jgi:hypothetical protein